jgi:SNF2 family DNA or RNA helicase
MSRSAGCGMPSVKPARWGLPPVHDSDLNAPDVEIVDVKLTTHTTTNRALDEPLSLQVREARLLTGEPWIRSLGKLSMEVSTEGWRFPAPQELPAGMHAFRAPNAHNSKSALPIRNQSSRINHPLPRVRPSDETVVVKDRLFYLLQPPLENLLLSKQLRLASTPYAYQMEGIAFLMPRHAALLADEMGLGKTMQAILALRLSFHAGLVKSALVVCPKSLVHNWCRELRQWGDDLPFEIISGDAQARRASWLVSNCPLKLANYEILTRDAALIAGERMHFDVVVLDEAQRIKNSQSKTAETVCSIRRQRSWALTGTPVENRVDDLVNLFAFIDPGRVPPGTPAKRVAQLTSDCTLRRRKEDVLTELPPKTIRDAYLELTVAQRDAYVRAEKEGIIHLNSLGDTITVQHVFELILRLKQICNFDPLTRESVKLDQLQSDVAEVSESGRKVVVFSQWVEPLLLLATALAPFGPLQFHGRVAPRERQHILETFRSDPSKRVLLMSYGTGSVGLNLQIANYVFLFDRWWNPAVEDQAINRAHRIGQANPVFVTRFVTQDTIEERIAEVLEKKRAMFAELVEQNGPPPRMGLTEEEIFGLFDIQVRPKRIAA